MPTDPDIAGGIFAATFFIFQKSLIFERTTIYLKEFPIHCRQPVTSSPSQLSRNERAMRTTYEFSIYVLTCSIIRVMKYYVWNKSTDQSASGWSQIKRQTWSNHIQIIEPATKEELKNTIPPFSILRKPWNLHRRLSTQDEMEKISIMF